MKKSIFTAFLALCVVVCFVLFMLLTELHNRVFGWAEAETEAIGISRHLIPAPDGRIISDPDDPMLIEENDGGYTMFGTASWYDYTFNPDYTTRVCFISREDCYTEAHLVAAMRDAPRGTTVKVTRLGTDRSVEVLITDYGPDGNLHPARIIDLSSAAFRQLGELDEGLFEVKVEWQL